MCRSTGTRFSFLGLQSISYELLGADARVITDLPRFHDRMMFYEVVMNSKVIVIVKPCSRIMISSNSNKKEKILA